MQLHFLFSAFPEETLAAIHRAQESLPCHSSSLRGWLGHQFSPPLCGTGCVPPAWLAVRAAVLLVKGLLSSLSLLHCLLLQAERPAAGAAVGVGSDLRAPAWTRTGYRHLRCAAPPVPGMLSHLSQTTHPSAGSCVNPLQLTRTPVTSHKSQSEQCHHLGCASASALPLSSPHHPPLSLPVLASC